MTIAALWPKTYRYLRSLGATHHDAEDLTQEVFVSLANRGILSWGSEATRDDADPLPGYVFTTARHLLIDKHRKATAAKRSYQSESGALPPEETCKSRGIDPNTPATEATRREAWRAWETQVARLGEELAKKGKSALFQSLRPYLQIGDRAQGIADTAKAMGMNPPALRGQIHRWRQRLIRKLSEEYADLEAA